jgi:hypothetical protein
MKTYVQMAVALMWALALRAGAQTDAAPETSCKPCHTEARPTRERADLAPCTRVEPRGTHTAAEGPDRITMSEGTGHYGRVEFSHKVHAEMAEMGRGCIECHHEATEGQAMRRCGECHSPSRIREDLETTDLRGAMHRQCMGCHEQWDPEMQCSSCHQEQDTPPFRVNAELQASPAATNMVLLKFHRGLTCRHCHGDPRKPGTLESACASCHEDWPASFDHRLTGLALDETHLEASCEDCHADATFAATPICTSCHDEDIAYPADLPGERIDKATGPEKGAPR